MKDDEEEDLTDSPFLQKESDLKAKIPSIGDLNVPVDPEKYMVSSGDMFIIKVDQTGPAIRVFNSPVTPEGYIILPEICGVGIYFYRVGESESDWD